MLIYTMLDNNTYLLFFLHIEEDGNKNATYNKRYSKNIYDINPKALDLYEKL